MCELLECGSQKCSAEASNSQAVSLNLLRFVM